MSFDFLGFTFRPRKARDQNGEVFLSFLPGVSKKALISMRQMVRRWKLHFRNSESINSLAMKFNPIIRGWFNYYSKFYKTALYPLWCNINYHLVKWLRWKFKKLKTKKVKSIRLLHKIAGENKHLFVHWQHGYRRV